MKKIAINVPPKLAEAFEKADGESKGTANDRLFNIMKKATS